MFTAVLDGETIEVLHINCFERIRLNGIDCPEKGQAYGKKAKQATSELVLGKEVTLMTHGLDKYGRTIADLALPDGIVVNLELVRNGWCWWYQEYAPDNGEHEAQGSGYGLILTPCRPGYTVGCTRVPIPRHPAFLNSLTRTQCIDT